MSQTGDTTEFSIDVVIKLGGSAITEKNKFETSNESSLQDAATLIKKCVSAGLKCVVIHGAGSFGHHQAKKYGVHNGYEHVTVEEEKLSIVRGFSLTRQSVLKLQQQVLDALLKEAIPAVALSPCGQWRTEGGEVIKSNIDTVCSMVQAGFLPVLHGDCVLDAQKGCSILSGDTIIKTLCRMVSVKKVLFLTDVEGVYNKPPDLPGAVLVPNVNIDREEKMQESITMTSSDCDVTGGIRLKLNSAVCIVRESEGRTPVFICRLGSEAAETFALTRTPVQEVTFTTGTMVSWPT